MSAKTSRIWTPRHPEALVVLKSELIAWLAEHATPVAVGDLSIGDGLWTLETGDGLAVCYASHSAVTALRYPAMTVGAEQRNGWRWVEIECTTGGHTWTGMKKSTEVVFRLSAAPHANPEQETTTP